MKTWNTINFILISILYHSSINFFTIWYILLLIEIMMWIISSSILNFCSSFNGIAINTRISYRFNISIYFNIKCTIISNIKLYIYIIVNKISNYITIIIYFIIHIICYITSIEIIHFIFNSKSINSKIFRIKMYLKRELIIKFPRSIWFSCSYCIINN